MDKRSNGIAVGVPAADRIIVQGKEREGEVPPIKELSLAYIEAPKMANPHKKAEPFSLAAREFVRKLIAGKKVYFTIEFKREGKEFASVWSDDSSTGNGVDIAEELIKQGYAQISTHNAEGKEEDKLMTSEKYLSLKELQEQARKADKGVWARKADFIATHSYNIVFPNSTTYDFVKLLEEIKKEAGKTEGIVEYVHSQSTYNVYLPKYSVIIKLALEYVHNLPGGQKATEQQKKLNNRAKAFAERLILHRDVKITTTSYDASSGSFSGRMSSMDNLDVGSEILTNGYARMPKQDPSMDEVYYAKLRMAMNQAQVAAKGLWKDAAAGKSEEEKKGKVSKYSAKVLEVKSGDSVVLVKAGDDEEKQIFLTGIRAPTVPTPQNPEKGQPYAWEAKEFLRKMLVGKQVDIEDEYTKIPQKLEADATETKKRPMTFANLVLQDGRCANVEMVEAGWAMDVKPRTDETLTKHYSNIVEAAKRAKDAKKGIHNVSKTPPVHSYQDLVGPQNSKTLAYYQEIFSKNPHATGVVEYCYSGSRFKFRVNEANCYISFICHGLQPIIQDPNVPELATVTKLGQKFARNVILQRDIEVEITSSDKKGNFFGNIAGSSQGYVPSLLEEGLAIVNRTPGRGPVKKREQYEQAEAKAKKEQKGLWDPKLLAALDAIRPSGESEFEIIEGKSNIEIVDYPNNRYFYAVHTDESMLKKTEEGMSKLFNPAKAEKLVAPIRKGTYCMALYSTDNKWYRGFIERTITETTCAVLFIDYGNTETLNINEIKKIDPKLIKDYPPCGFKIGLAYLDLPTLDVECGGKKLRTLLQNQLDGQEINAIHKYKQDGVVYAILMQGKDTEPMKSFNAYLIKKGLAKITKRIKLPGNLIEWNDMQDKARSETTGLWETNELYEGDDD